MVVDCIVISKTEETPVERRLMSWTDFWRNKKWKIHPQLQLGESPWNISRILFYEIFFKNHPTVEISRGEMRWLTKHNVPVTSASLVSPCDVCLRRPSVRWCGTTFPQVCICPAWCDPLGTLTQAACLLNRVRAMGITCLDHLLGTPF